MASINNTQAAIQHYGQPEGQDARWLGDQARLLSKDKRILLHIALDDARLQHLQDHLAFFFPDIDVVVLPPWDCLPYDRVSPNADVSAQRIDALFKIISWRQDGLYKPRIILTSINAVMQRVIPVDALKDSGLFLKVKGQLNQKQFERFLADNGYSRTDTVREAGDFSIRGGIIDLFPPGTEEPLRMDLFGDDIETIRYFDPITQRTTGVCDSFSFKPVTEYFLNPESVARFRSRYRELFGVISQPDPLYESVSESRRYNGVEHWQPLFFEQLDTLFDYVPQAFISLDHQADLAAHERQAQVQDLYQARLTLDKSIKDRKKQKNIHDVSISGSVYHPLPPDLLYLNEQEYLSCLSRFAPFYALVPFSSPEEMVEEESNEAKRVRDFADVRAQPNGDIFAEVKHYLNLTARGRTVGIACYSQGSCDRLKVMMEHAGFYDVVICPDYQSLCRLRWPQAGLVVLPIEHGFIASDLLLLSEQDILGDRLARRVRKKRKADNFLREISSLNVGDLVVHADHGVGRFESLETLKAGGIVHDCLKIVYAGGDKLFVPVENIEVLSRFGSEDSQTDLDKLGGAGWQARKAKVKKDLMRIAEHLLKIAAERALRKADVFDVSPLSYSDFVARFPYSETDDQLRAIDDTLQDLHSGQPMDRLVCGDVGFGKTEVAIRAAYIAAMNGTQVAVIAPTTLLARQHYQTFRSRFEGSDIRVDHISRLVNARDSKNIKEYVADGKTHILVGTHALLGKGVSFDNLGLVIVDEEQRFGVKQKERLKELKANVHMLTLTATPIPRTLQMALTGVRDMSVIATPPVDRLAIRTSVMPYDPMVIREAILREHYRGGQTFFVCPRVKDIQAMEEHLRELVPEVKVISAHGQMTPTDLEDRMTAFYERQYGVLLATNIIESGIDIPTANTMIVHRSDLFGLSQLYQIRGRVGRSKTRAYAYITYDPMTKLTAQAQKRLEIFETLDSLGAGFQLASHDMDIRGAGNLLGEEQSGHIREVGVELYQQMLEDAVADARAGGQINNSIDDKGWSPTINIGTSVLIPEKYVEDLSVRMSLYRRLGDLQDDGEVESFAAELIDRFGALPEEVANLLDIVKIKILCRRAGIDHVEAGPKGAVIGYRHNQPPNPEKLFAWLQQRAGSVKVRPDQKLSLLRAWERPVDRVKGIKSIAYDLAQIA